MLLLAAVLPSMRSTSSLLRVVALAASAALHAAQPCNPNPFRPSMLPPCNNLGTKIGNAVAATIEVKARIAEANEMIYEARQRFWAVYPDGPGYAEAEATFLHALSEKNASYLSMYLVSGMRGPAVSMINVLNFGPGVTVDQYRRRLRGDITLIDGGINPSAYPLFVQWVNSLRRQGGAMKDGDILLNPLPLGLAISQPSSRRQAYERAQYWAEILASGVDLRKYFTPELYMQLTMETRVSVQLGAAETPDIPDCQAATVALYQTLVRIMGEKEVANAAAAVLAAPKSAWGDLATPVTVDIGINQAETYEPFLRFLDLLAGSRPRNYAISMLLDPSQLDTNYSIKEKWIEAAGKYDQLVRQHGESVVLAAASRIKSAQKSANGGIRGDPQYRRTNEWFDLVLKDPKTVVPDGSLPHFKASSYNERWLGKFLAVRGTVSRVDVDSGGQPVYATIHFKESSARGIMAFTPYSKWLQGEYGNDFAKLIGKPVEIYGEVQDWREGAGVRVLDLRQMAMLTAGFPDEADSKPDWLTAPAAALVENPEYAAWKKFPAGTTVTLVDRSFFEATPRSDQYQRSDIGRTILRLESIDATRAVIVILATSNNNGVPTTAAERTLVHKAIMPPQAPRPPPNESGEETLVISGKKYVTHWESYWGNKPGSVPTPDPAKYVKKWYCDDVPGRQVLVRQQSYSGIGENIHRRFNITMIEPVAGIEPEIGELKPDAPKSKLLVSTVSEDEIRKRYTALGERAMATKEKLNEWQKARGWVNPPPKIYDAPYFADFEMRKVWPAIMMKNLAAAETAMRAAEENWDLVDRFLKTGEVPSEPKKAPQAKTSGTNKVVAPTPTPPASTPRVDSTSVTLDTPAGMAEFGQKLGALMTRVGKAKMDLIIFQSAPGKAVLPAEISNARDRLDGELIAASRAVSARNTPQAEQGLRTAEATVVVIEQYLNRQPSR
jgi:hypothetical protein